MRYTKTTLEKLEKILKQQGYTIRYEKGNFQSGSCVVMLKKMVVINKFFPIDQQIKSLINTIYSVDLNEEIFTDETKDTFNKIQQFSLFQPQNA